MTLSQLPCKTPQWLTQALSMMLSESMAAQQLFVKVCVLVRGGCTLTNRMRDFISISPPFSGRVAKQASTIWTPSS